MDVVETYNRLQELISSYNHFKLLIKLSKENNNKIKDIALDIKNIIYLLENDTYDVILFKNKLDKLYTKISIKAYSEEYIEDLEIKLTSIKQEIDSIFLSLSNEVLLKKEINTLDNVTRLELSYYNYCIERLKEYLNNYNNHNPLEFDYLNEKLKEEIFINRKPKIRKR